MSYHYTDSGLDNVFLQNGYRIHQTPYGVGVSIEDVEGLHHAIGDWIVHAPKPLNGAEVRFLRLEMDLSQRRLADLIGSEEQNVRRWEKARSRQIPGTADRMIRALYVSYCDNDSTVRTLVEQLAELDEIEAGRLTFEDTDSGWRIAA